jgi:hypothetical protein
MKIFSGNDAFLTTEFICNSLRAKAKLDAIDGAYPKEEHVCWDAARAIEVLVDMVDGKSLSVRLRDIADKVEALENTND